MRSHRRALIALSLSLAASAAILSGGCSSNGPLGTCQWHVPGVCVEDDGDADAAHDACAVANGTFEEGKVCPSEDRIGGCRTTTTSAAHGTVEETVWYYPGAGETHDTAAEIQASCTAHGGEFLPPG